MAVEAELAVAIDSDSLQELRRALFLQRVRNRLVTLAPLFRSHLNCELPMTQSLYLRTHKSRTLLGGRYLGRRPA